MKWSWLKAWAMKIALGGHDTFVFNGNFGTQNYVMDFHQLEDLIDINAAHGLSLSDLTITTVPSTQISGSIDST